MKSAVIVFPASNCDRDAQIALTELTGTKPFMVWHADSDVPDCDLIVLPGGFSYGDYLRCGAMAAQSHIMRDVKKKADAGVAVLGICNGFQILCEAGLLPGALMRNAGLHFICRYVNLKVENGDTPYTSEIADGKVLSVPIAHAEGNYVCDDDTFNLLEENGQIIFRYCDETGAVTNEANPNGARSNIAGICNQNRNVLGMMPHPERACEELLGSTDGRGIFSSLTKAIAAAGN